MGSKADWGVSDHNVLLIRMVHRENVGTNEGMRRWVCKDVDWEGYMCDMRESALEDAASAIDEADAQSCVERMMKWIHSANDRWMKRCKPVYARKLVWWTDELEKLKKAVGRSRRAYQRARKRNGSRVEERMNEYKYVLREYKEEMRRVKEENWKRFVCVTGKRDPWSDVYKVCMGKRDRVRLSGIKVGDRVTSTWKESADELMKRFFPAARTNVAIDARGDVREEEKQFEWSEVDVAVRSMKVGKAPGMDGVSAEMLRAIWRAVPVWMKRMYDVCLNTACFPPAWKTARVVVLLKSPDKPRSDPGSYRPI